MKLKIDHTIGLILFAAFYLFGIILNNLAHPLEAWVKGFSTLFLIIPLIFHRGAMTKSLQATLISALVFCAAGDFALVIRSYEPFVIYNDVLFQVGLATYLIGYLSIGIILTANGILDRLTYIVLALFSAISVLQFFTFENVGPELYVPVILYLIQATLLVTSAFAFRNRIHGKEKWFLIVGSIIIYISDSYIGHETFTGNIPFAQHIITYTYYFGLLFIIGGLTILEKLVPKGEAGEHDDMDPRVP